MKSRYDFMTASYVRDSEGNNFPDPLTLNYNNIKVNNKPNLIEMNEDAISYFWRTTYAQYGEAAYDDIVLSLNNVPHKNLISEDAYIIFPSKTDIEESFS